MARKLRAPFAKIAGHSEFGGGPGLVQSRLAPDGSPGHTPTPSEVSSAMHRAPATDYLTSDEANIIRGQE